MRMDIEDHELVPEHEVMDEDAVEQLLDEYGIGKEQLPRIERTDAAVKQLEAEVGDVIRIERASPTAGETTYYRRVIEG
ncbi:MAG: DNA-directed RNA polymerase subunit H [Candidatus Nanohaloarchaea archaeon]